jgi:hypothetical protein
MRSRLVATVMMLFCLAPSMARAAPHGTALVIGIGTYDNKPLLPTCIHIADAVSAHLRANGFVVDELTDPGSIVLRSAIGDFADAVLAKNPSDPALIYVCARAATLDHRIFLLPSDATPQAMLRLQTEGTVLRALMNTFTGNNSMLIADLGMSANAADIAAAAQDRPDVLQVALRAGLGDRLGNFGERLATSPLQVPSAAVGSAVLWSNVAKSLHAAAGPGPGIAFAVAPSPVTSTVPLAPTPPVGPPVVTSSSNAAAPAITATAPPAPAPTPPALAIAAPPPPALSTPTQPPAGAAKEPEPEEKLATAAPVPMRLTPRPKALSGSPRIFVDGRTSRIQEALARRGLYHGPVNGMPNARTARAIRAFQVSLGDRPTGGLTRIQIIRLLNTW